MTICILMEDSHRKSGKALAVLARRIIGRRGVLPKSLQRGELLDSRKLRVHLDNLKNPGRISKVIVCVDSHSDPARVQAITSSIEMKLANSVRFPIKYVVVVHALETWLLQDPKTIQKVLGVGISSQRFQQMENSCSPDRDLSLVCNSFTKSIHDERIARRADIHMIASRSLSFQQFVDALTEP